MSSSTRSITLPKLNVSKDMSLEKCEEHLSSYLQGNVTQRDDSSLIANGILKGTPMSNKAHAAVMTVSVNDARYHFIKECTKLGIVELIHIPRNDNLADLFTHPVARAIHKQMRCDVLNLGKKVIQESTNQYIGMAIMSSITV